MDSREGYITAVGGSSFPLGRRLARIKKELDRLLDTGELGEKWQILSAEEHRLEDIIIERNLKGVELEGCGDVDAAIDLYEQNAADEVDSLHPYSRLVAIYRLQERVEDEKRILEKALVVFGDTSLWQEQRPKPRRRRGGEDHQG